MQRQYRNLIPIVGRVYRGVVVLSLVVFTGTVLYANLGDQRWGPLPVLQINWDDDAHPVSANDRL